MLKACKGLVIFLLLTKSMNPCMMPIRRLGWDKDVVLSLCKIRLLTSSEKAVAEKGGATEMVEASTSSMHDQAR
jgi:hypothetical protein